MLLEQAVPSIFDFSRRPSQRKKIMAKAVAFPVPPRTPRTMEGISKVLRSCLSASDVSSILERYGGLLETLLQDKVTDDKEYPDDMKQFAVTLNSLSTKAYDFLRCMVKLPHHGTLRLWALERSWASTSMEPIAQLKKRIQKQREEATCETGKEVCHRIFTNGQVSP